MHTLKMSSQFVFVTQKFIFIVIAYVYSNRFSYYIYTKVDVKTIQFVTSIIVGIFTRNLSSYMWNINIFMYNIQKLERQCQCHENYYCLTCKHQLFNGNEKRIRKKSKLGVLFKVFCYHFFNTQNWKKNFFKKSSNSKSVLV